MQARCRCLALGPHRHAFTDSSRGMPAAAVTGSRGWGQFKQFKEIGSQTYLRAAIGRQRVFRPVANPGEVEASCVFRALMRYEVKQHRFQIFEGDP